MFLLLVRDLLIFFLMNLMISLKMDKNYKNIIKKDVELSNIIKSNIK